MHQAVLTAEALSLTQQAPESYQSRRGSSEHSSLVAPVASFTESHTLCTWVSGKWRWSSSESLTVSTGVMGLHIPSWISYMSHPELRVCKLLQHLLTALGWEPVDFTTPSANLLFSGSFRPSDSTSVLGKAPWGSHCTLALLSSATPRELVSVQEALECGLLRALQA